MHIPELISPVPIIEEEDDYIEHPTNRWSESPQVGSLLCENVIDRYYGKDFEGACPVQTKEHKNPETNVKWNTLVTSPIFRWPNKTVEGGKYEMATRQMYKS
jgi:hypothetical protein